MKKILLIVMILILTLPIFSQKDEYKPDPAKPISIYQWLNGVPPIDSIIGRTIILDFWATWCGPCVKSIPHVNELVDSFACDTVLFISISKENPKVVKKFLEKNTLKSYVGIDNNGLTNKNYKIKSIPKIFIIDSYGYIVWEGHPAALSSKLLKFIIDKKHVRKKD